MSTNVAKHIKRLRLSRNMTQDDLAEQLHVTRQAVSNWEMGKTSVSVEYLTELAEIFNVSIEELIYGKISVAVYKKNKGKYIASSVICGVVLVTCLILCIVLVPVLENMAGKYFVVWPTIAYNGIWALMFFAAGGLILSLMSLKVDIRLYGWKKYLALSLAVLCLLLLIFTFAGGFLSFVGVIRRMLIAIQPSLKLLRTVLPFLSGVGIFLGLNH